MRKNKMNYTKPKPIIDDDSKNYWESAKLNKLVIQYSKNSNEYFLYSKQLINNIDDNDDNEIEWKEVSGKGTIYSYSIIHAPAGPSFVEDTPYIVASIQLDEGARIISNIINSDLSKIVIGKKVRVVFEKQTEELTIPKFEIYE